MLIITDLVCLQRILITYSDVLSYSRLYSVVSSTICLSSLASSNSLVRLYSLLPSILYFLITLSNCVLISLVNLTMLL